jgi:hypothetical protein
MGDGNGQVAYRVWLDQTGRRIRCFARPPAGDDQVIK